MPLSDHEQRILDEIERRLSEEDPKLVEQVGRTDLHVHLARRIRLASLAFGLGFVLVLAFVVSPWIAAIGFVVMVVAGVSLSRSLGQLRRDQSQTQPDDGGPLGRLLERLRRPAPGDDDEPPAIP